MSIKHYLGILVLSFVLVSPFTASASGIVAGNDSLLKLLENKGVISKDEAKDLKKNDEKKFLKIGGRLQTQYKHVNNGTATKANTNEFFVRRARFTFKAQVTPWGYFKVQPEFGKGNVTLKDAYIGFTPELKGFELDLGNQYVDFSREALNSSKYLHFVERTATSQFAPFRQLGVNFHQKMLDNKLKFNFGIFNGSLNPGKVGATKLNKGQIYHIDLAGFKSSSGQTGGPLFGGRIDFSPFGKFKKTQGDFGSGDSQFEIGVNFYSQNMGTTFAAANNGFDKNWAYGADFGYRGYGLSVEGEFIMRTLDFDATNPVVPNRSVRQKAYSIQGGYMVYSDTIELAARYEKLDFDNRGVYQGSKGEDAVRVIAFGANWYIKKHHLKLQANYVLNDERMPGGVADPKNDEVLVQGTYYF